MTPQDPSVSPKVWRAALPLILLVTALVGAGALRLNTAFDPKALLPSGGTEVPPWVEAQFPRTQGELLILVTGPSATTDEGLRHLHQLSRVFSAAPFVERVDSLSHTPFGRFAPAPNNLAELESLDDFDREDALLDLLESDPDTFPDGFASLSARTAGKQLTMKPIAADADTLREVELQALRRHIADPALAGRLVASDGSATVIVLHLRPGKDATLVTQAEEVLASHPAPAGLEAYPIGLPVVRETLAGQLQGDAPWLVSASTLLSALVLLLGFRSPRSVLVALASVGITLGLVTGTMGHLGIPITLITNVVPPLLVTLGLGDAVHLIHRYHHEGGRLAPTVRALWRPCLVTSTTTAAGFASLAMTGTPALQELALLASCAVMVAFAVTLFVLPLLLQRGFAAASARPAQARRAPWMPLARFAVRAPATVLISAAALAMLAGLAATWLRTDASLFSQLDEGTPLRQRIDLLEDQFGGVQQFEVFLRRAPAQAPTKNPRSTVPALDKAAFQDLAKLEAWLRKQPGVLRVDGPAALLQTAWDVIRGTEEPPADGALHSEGTGSRPFESDARLQALMQLLAPGEDGKSQAQAGALAPGGSAARIRVRLADAPLGETAALLERLETQMASLPQLQGVVRGEAAESARGLHSVVQDLVASLPLALVLVLAMIGLLFRSLRLALIAVPPNVLPLMIVLGYMGLRGIPLHASTVMVLPITLGLVVDGTIFLLSQHQERHPGEPLLLTFRNAGGGVLMSSMTLLAGFAALSFSQFLPIRLFAELSAVAITSALLAEFTLLPALLTCFATPRLEQS